MEASSLVQGQDEAENGSKTSRQDTWDIPEIDEFETPKRNAEESADDDLPKRTKERSTEGSDILPDSDSKRANYSSPAEGIVGLADDHGGVGHKRRRSFCNFHYCTTQGGSSSAEPGDDPAMQSPGTSTKALKLLEFVHNEGVSPLDTPQMRK